MKSSDFLFLRRRKIHGSEGFFWGDEGVGPGRKQVEVPGPEIELVPQQ